MAVLPRKLTWRLGPWRTSLVNVALRSGGIGERIATWDAPSVGRGAAVSAFYCSVTCSVLGSKVWSRTGHPVSAMGQSAIFREALMSSVFIVNLPVADAVTADVRNAVRLAGVGQVVTIRREIMERLADEITAQSAQELMAVRSCERTLPPEILNMRLG